MEKRAYVSLLTTNEFIKGLLVLYYSWQKTNSKYPFYCVITHRISLENRKLLEAVGIKLIIKQEIPMTPIICEYNKKHLKGCNNWYDAFSKFQVFGLEEFDKIIYIDCDTYIAQNIDNLFEKPHMSGAIDCDGLNTEVFDYLAEGDNYFKYFNSGLLVIEPSKDLFYDIMKFIANIKPKQVLADQNILHLYYPEWKDNYDLHLPVYYNILVPTLYQYVTKEWFDVNEIKVFHFVNKKPWQKTTLNPQEQQYMTILRDIKETLLRQGYSSPDL